MTTFAQRDARLKPLLDRMTVPFARALCRTEVARALGRRGMEVALAQGALLRLLPDTYVVRAAAHRHDVQAAAVLHWGRRDVILTGASTLHLYDDRFERPAVVRCVARPGRGYRAPSWVRLTRRELPAWTASVAGQVSVPLAQAVLDAWADAAPGRRDTWVYDALWRRVTTARDIGRELRMRPRVPERRRLEALLERFERGATSPSEVIARCDVFRGGSWRELEWQVEIEAAGRRRIADAFHRAARVVVEFDGAAYHESADAVRRDRERDAELAGAGFLTVRFSYGDLRDRPQWCREALARTIQSRLRPSAT